MRLKLTNSKTGGDFILLKGESAFDRLYFSRDKNKKYFTIAWNQGASQTISIDGTEHEFKTNTLVTLLFNQSFNFENSVDIVAWQFNREFYCIIDNDAEVSCVGFLFGSTDHLFINLDATAQQKLTLLLDVFTEEFKTPDNIQNELLMVLLKRLIVVITRLARAEHMPQQKLQEEKFHVIRKFNLLVEAHYRSEHSVSFYAKQLNKSPKTLSNLFAIYNHKTPLQVIQERILIEARRLLYYTNESIKQITYDLGFEDAAYFSNFFKKHSDMSPLEFRNSKFSTAAGK